MKHLKRFENFNDMGRFSDEEDDMMVNNNLLDEDEFGCGCQNGKCRCGDGCECDDQSEEEEDDFESEREKEDGRTWGDEIVERKKAKISKEKIVSSAIKKGEKQLECSKKKCGLTAAQKKLPPALQKAILSKKK